MDRLVEGISVAPELGHLFLCKQLMCLAQGLVSMSLKGSLGTIPGGRWLLSPPSHSRRSLLFPTCLLLRAYLMWYFEHIKFASS